MWFGKGQHLQFFSSQPLNSIGRLGSVFGNAAGRMRHRQKVALAENNREGRREDEREIHFSSQPGFEEPSLLLTKRRAKHKNALACVLIPKLLQVSDATDGANREKGKGRGTDEQIFRPGR